MYIDRKLNHNHSCISSMLMNYSTLYSLKLRISYRCCSVQKNTQSRIIGKKIMMRMSNSLPDIFCMQKFESLKSIDHNKSTPSHHCMF